MKRISIIVENIIKENNTDPILTVSQKLFLDSLKQNKRKYVKKASQPKPKVMFVMEI